MDLFNYHPRRSHSVRVGNICIGGDAPLQLQSMTTTPTADVAASVAQVRSIAAAGAGLVRLTAQGQREVGALREIVAALRAEGCAVPLVADVHFNPAVADSAAEVVEKVRINPGNYVDPARQFKYLEYSDEEYAAELARLEARFLQFLEICRRHGTAVRIGVNHGSLSDRIMSRYGDTPAGIVESCMEFLRVCQRTGFHDVVVSIKASNTRVMVTSMRRLVRAMQEEGMTFPLHLGVTEAGAGEDGRIRSAVGIGALLCDGIGDTLRVSLSEAPEAELPVVYELARHCVARAGHAGIPGKPCEQFVYEDPQRRPTIPVGRTGGTQTPVVVAQYEKDATWAEQARPDYLYCGREIPAHLEEGITYIVDADVFLKSKELGMRSEECALRDNNAQCTMHNAQSVPNGTLHSSLLTPPSLIPAFTPETLMLMGACGGGEKVLFLTYLGLTAEVRAALRQHPDTFVIAQSNHANRLGEQRALVHELWREGLANPVVFFEHYPAALTPEQFRLHSAADLGALLIDSLADGVFLLSQKGGVGAAVCAETAFGILQAAGLRTSRTEYISCPGCGRTLYDLPATLAAVRDATQHLVGVKIAVMGCIVNGPGEMADADYGYVGAARGRVSLYRGRVCVEKNIPAEEAPQRLLALIETDRAAEK